MSNLQIGSKIQILEQVIKFFTEIDDTIAIEPHEIASLNMEPICQLFDIMINRLQALRQGLISHTAFSEIKHHLIRETRTFTKAGSILLCSTDNQGTYKTRDRLEWQIKSSTGEF